MKHASFLSMLVASLTLMPLQACSAFNGPISGVVVDATTHVPVVDAIVVVRWHASRIHSSSCSHVATARTDANGRSKIDGWVDPWSIGDIFESSTDTDSLAYKPEEQIIGFLKHAPTRGEQQACRKLRTGRQHREPAGPRLCYYVEFGQQSSVAATG